MKQELAVGSRVKLVAPMDVPAWCEYDDDRGRVSKHAKDVIRERFFKCDPKLTSEIIHVANETERTRLRRAGRTKVRVRLPSGDTIIITVELEKLTKA